MTEKKESIQNARQSGSSDFSSTSRSFTLALFLLLTGIALGGRGQRRQRQAEESLRPYIGRVQPEKLCELLKCRTPVGSWCQVVKYKGALVPMCVCPKTCSRQRAPVCSVVGKTYMNECFLHKEACRKRRRTGLAHTGPCMIPRDNCTQEELGQFPYRLLDWFLLLSRMGESYAPDAPTQSCLSHAQRIQLAQQRFALLDRNRDGKLSRRDLRKLHYKRMPLEHCATSFFQKRCWLCQCQAIPSNDNVYYPLRLPLLWIDSNCRSILQRWWSRSCDTDRNRKVTLREWTTCLVDNSEAWFYHFMSIRMGSHKMCSTRTDDDL